MTQDEIIEMAVQVYGTSNWNDSQLERLEAFAKLVAAKELRELGQIIFDYAGRDGLTLEEEALLKHLYEILRARGEA